jgi:hypothetical protein
MLRTRSEEAEGKVIEIGSVILKKWHVKQVNVPGEMHGFLSRRQINFPGAWA